MSDEKRLRDLSLYPVEKCAKLWKVTTRQAYNIAEKLRGKGKRFIRYNQSTLDKLEAVPVYPQMTSQSALKLWNLPTELLLCQSAGQIAWVSLEAKTEFLERERKKQKGEKV